MAPKDLPPQKTNENYSNLLADHPSLPRMVNRLLAVLSHLERRLPVGEAEREAEEKHGDSQLSWFCWKCLKIVVRCLRFISCFLMFLEASFDLPLSCCFARVYVVYVCPFSTSTQIGSNRFCLFSAHGVLLNRCSSSKVLEPSYRWPHPLIAGEALKHWGLQCQEDGLLEAGSSVPMVPPWAGVLSEDIRGKVVFISWKASWRSWSQESVSSQQIEPRLNLEIFQGGFDHLAKLPKQSVFEACYLTNDPPPKKKKKNMPNWSFVV